MGGQYGVLRTSVLHNGFDFGTDRCRDRDALAVGKPAAEWVGARSDRGACPQRSVDRGEPAQRRSLGCADVGSSGPDRSAAAVSSETPQRKSAGRPDPNPSTSRAGARTNRAGEHGTRAGEVLWRTAAWM